MIVTGRDLSAVFLVLVSFIFADYLGVCDLSMAVGWGIFAADDVKGVYIFDSLRSAVGTLVNALAETHKFVGLGGVTCLRHPCTLDDDIAHGIQVSYLHQDRRHGGPMH